MIHQYRCGPVAEIRMLTPADIIIFIHPHSFKVVHVAHDIPEHHNALRAVRPGAIAIFGPLAQTFYMALAGRKYDEPPEKATLSRAQVARDLLRYNSEAYPIQDIIARTIQLHYIEKIETPTSWQLINKIDPWLGTTRLTTTGQIQA